LWTGNLLTQLKIKKMGKENYVKKLGLKPGDRIVVPKSGLRIVQHHALYLGQNHQGIDLIAENKIGFGVRLITADEFFKDVIEVTKIEKFHGTNYKRKLAVQKALQKLGQPYHLIDYNCQHFANEIQYNQIKSEQVDGLFEGLKVAAGIAIVIGLFNLFTND
jgi:Lecithin retinol acyltransferase